MFLPFVSDTVKRFADAPCTDPSFGFMWDGKREKETRRRAERRWREARRVCHLRCTLIAECAELMAAQHDAKRPTDGVWAGMINPKPEDVK